MTREEQAKIILREIDEVYSVSTYMEKYVINAIMAGLDEIYSMEEGNIDKLKIEREA